MAKPKKRKATRRTKAVRKPAPPKRKSGRAKAARLPPASRRRKPVRGKATARRRPTARKPRLRSKTTRKPKKPVRPVRTSSRRPRGRADATDERPEYGRGLGPESGGQSGDTEGLSRAELADSESVEELVEEGQAFEAGVIEGIEDAPDADEGEVRTREVPEDDVPEEYLDED